MSKQRKPADQREKDLRLAMFRMQQGRARHTTERSVLWPNERVVAGGATGALSIIAKGTYDEKNWQLLRERWDDLRIQLHGVVISPLVAGKSALPMAVVDEINAAAPNFSPLTGIGVPSA